MNKKLLNLIVKIDWESSATSGFAGLLLFFIWHVLKSGESGPELPQMRILGLILVISGCICLCISLFTLIRSIRRI